MTKLNNESLKDQRERTKLKYNETLKENRKELISQLTITFGVIELLSVIMLLLAFNSGVDEDFMAYFKTILIGTTILMPVLVAINVIKHMNTRYIEASNETVREVSLNSKIKFLEILYSELFGKDIIAKEYLVTEEDELRAMHSKYIDFGGADSISKADIQRSENLLEKLEHIDRNGTKHKNLQAIYNIFLQLNGMKKLYHGVEKQQNTMFIKYKDKLNIGQTPLLGTGDLSVLDLPSETAIYFDLNKPEIETIKPIDNNHQKLN